MEKFLLVALVASFVSGCRSTPTTKASADGNNVSQKSKAVDAKPNADFGTPLNGDSRFQDSPQAAATPPFGKPLKEGDVAQIQKSVTTQQDLVRLFGAPSGDVDVSEDRTELTWSHSSTPVFGTGMRVSTLKVMLGADGKVRSSKFDKQIVTAHLHPDNRPIPAGGHSFKEENVAQIQKGVTNQQDLVRLFGRPLEDEELGEGHTGLTWSHTSVPVIGSGIRVSTLKILLGPAGKVRSYKLEKTVRGMPAESDS